MPRDGSGVYSLASGTEAVATQTISSAKFNSLTSDLESDANTARPVTAGGTGVTSIAAFKTAFSLTIGTDVQAYNAGLTAIAGETPAADKLPYYTGSSTAALADFSAYARTILDDANAAAARATLELETIGESEAEAGTGTTQRAFTAERVKQAVKALCSGVPSAVIEDQKSKGTSGGSYSTGAWRTRDLNTEVFDTNSLISISSNEFTVVNAGYVERSAPSWSTNNGFQSRLYNVTDSAVVGYGTSMSSIENLTAVSEGCARVIAGKTYRIEHRANAGHSDGYGRAANVTDGTEVYTRVKYWSD